MPAPFRVAFPEVPPARRKRSGLDSRVHFSEPRHQYRDIVFGAAPRQSICFFLFAGVDHIEKPAGVLTIQKRLAEFVVHRHLYIVGESFRRHITL